MIKKILLITILATVLLLYPSRNRPRPAATNNRIVPPEPLITDSAFYDPQLFYAGIIYADLSGTKFDTKPSILIIPHHLTAAYMAADLLRAATRFNYQNIYLIGPNHSETGDQTFLYIPPEKTNPIADTDHSIGNPMLFINYYFRNTSIHKIVIKNQAKPEEIKKWARDISVYSDNSLYVFSIDFSHYLPAVTAANNDEYTTKLIKSLDTISILKLNNSHADSPSSLALAVSLAKTLNTRDITTHHHTNSGLLQNDFSTGTTSYFGISFGQ